MAVPIISQNIMHSRYWEGGFHLCQCQCFSSYFCEKMNKPQSTTTMSHWHDDAYISGWGWPTVSKMSISILKYKPGGEEIHVWLWSITITIPCKCFILLRLFWSHEKHHWNYSKVITAQYREKPVCNIFCSASTSHESVCRRKTTRRSTLFINK